MRIPTPFTDMFGCRLPVVVAPMFLVSNVDMVVAAGEAGAMGTFPALNVRPVEKLRDWIAEIKQKTRAPYGVNLIVHHANIYFKRQMEICLEERVPLIIASLGNPAPLIAGAHEVGSKVFCDIIEMKHARKAVDAGADGLIAVGSGAGGHRGEISPVVWVPYLKKHFTVPVLAAGGITDGRGLAAALALGAAGAYMGTRFIASEECKVARDYQNAILRAQPEDIVTTYRMDGVAANIIDTPYVRKVGTRLTVLDRLLSRNRKLRSWLMAYRALRSFSLLKNAVERPTWKQLWGAGQGVGLIEDILPIARILENMVREYRQTLESLPRHTEDDNPNHQPNGHE